MRAFHCRPVRERLPCVIRRVDEGIVDFVFDAIVGRIHLVILQETKIGQMFP